MMLAAVKLSACCIVIAATVAGCATQRKTAKDIGSPRQTDVAQAPSDGNGASRGENVPAQVTANVTRLPQPNEPESSGVRQVAFDAPADAGDKPEAPSIVDLDSYFEELPLSGPEQPTQADVNQAEVVPIDFATALALAAGDNPQVEFARQRINEAFAQWRTAEVMWVPSLRGGMNYNKHEGTIQDVEGNIIETSRGSVYTGFGAQAVGASSPAVPGLVIDLHMRDAIFQPRIASRLLAASRQASRATTNDILFDTATAYNDLLEALAYEAVAKSTLENTRRLVDVTTDFVRRSGIARRRRSRSGRAFRGADRSAACHGKRENGLGAAGANT